MAKNQPKLEMTQHLSLYTANPQHQCRTLSYTKFTSETIYYNQDIKKLLENNKAAIHLLPI
jgi:hypothetical protein